MEQTEEFESALLKLLLEAKRRLGVSDKTIAYILLREGTKYYLRQINGEESGIRSTKEHHPG